MGLLVGWVVSLTHYPGNLCGMRIATWNINSVRTRTQRALNLISKHDIDVLCLQETKVKDDKFPREVFEDAGLPLSLIHI